MTLQVSAVMNTKPDSACLPGHSTFVLASRTFRATLGCSGCLNLNSAGSFSHQTDRQTGTGKLGRSRVNEIRVTFTKTRCRRPLTSEPLGGTVPLSQGAVVMTEPVAGSCRPRQERLCSETDHASAFQQKSLFAACLRPRWPPLSTSPRPPRRGLGASTRKAPDPDRPGPVPTLAARSESLPRVCFRPTSTRRRLCPKAPGVPPPGQ